MNLPTLAFRIQSIRRHFVPLCRVSTKRGSIAQLLSQVPYSEMKREINENKLANLYLARELCKHTIFLTLRRSNVILV